LGFLTGTSCGEVFEFLAKYRPFEVRLLWEDRNRVIKRKRKTIAKIFLFTVLK